MRTADAVGLAPAAPQITFASVMAHVHGARRRIEPQDSVDRLRRAGVEVVHGSARFTGPKRIVVAGVGEIAFRAALIASGSSPVLPSIEDLGSSAPLTNETVWDLTALPASHGAGGRASVGGPYPGRTPSCRP